MKHHLFVLAAAALAAPALLTACGSSTSQDAASEPTSVGTTLASAGLTTAALLIDQDTVYSDGADWVRTSAFEGDGHDVFNPCARESLEGTGATSVVRADFELRNTEDPAVEVVGDHLIQVAGQYDDEAAATAAYQQISDWVATCKERSVDITEYRSLGSRPVDIDGGTAQVIDAHYGPTPKEVDPSGDAAYIMETGVLRMDNRVTVLTSVIIGQDYNFLDGTPVERMLVPAGERLGQDAADTSTGSSSGPPPAVSSSAAAIPDVLDPGFDLLWHMLKNDDGTPVVVTHDGQGVGPIEFCGKKIDLTVKARDRIAANASGPEYGEGREVLVFPDDAAAAKAVTDVLEAARDCPEQDFSGTTWKHAVKAYDDAGIPTDVITRTYENDGQPSLGLDTLVVGRDGRVVLLAVRGGEGSAADGEESARKFLDDLGTTIGWIVDSVEG